MESSGERVRYSGCQQLKARIPSESSLLHSIMQSGTTCFQNKEFGRTVFTKRYLFLDMCRKFRA